MKLVENTYVGLCLKWRQSSADGSQASGDTQGKWKADVSRESMKDACNSQLQYSELVWLPNRYHSAKDHLSVSFVFFYSFYRVISTFHNY